MSYTIKEGIEYLSENFVSIYIIGLLPEVSEKMEGNGSELVWGIIIGVIIYGIFREILRRKTKLNEVQAICISVVAGFAVYILFMLGASVGFLNLKMDLLAVMALAFIYISTFFTINDWKRRKDKDRK
jgi:hypothetical protein